MPSPQELLQARRTPFASAHTGSIWQNGVHPSPMSKLSSSHGSSPSTAPSPQSVGSHSLGSPSHLKPGSSWHVGEQPSSTAVPSSSHCSLPATMPSPHSRARQRTPGGQIQPSSIWHSSSQPSSAVVLPSSHVSVAISLRSPQRTRDTHGSPGTRQSQRSSITQSALQPSPPTGGSSPSSHSSPFCGLSPPDRKSTRL